MNLATQRPKSWTAVAGQDRPIRILQSVLTTARFMPRGFVMEGVTGVGKTTVAYLLARALMCTGNHPLGCKVSTGTMLDVGICPSCRTIDSTGIDSHPDFKEVDGAYARGVDISREIVTLSEAMPVLGRRRITMLDEAHALTAEAWKVYLKPLEQPDTNAIFIACSNHAELIPEEIRNRCCKTKFGRVPTEVILGLLSNLAHTNSVKADLDALKLISRVSKGIVRDAVQLLSTCASIGDVTKQLVTDVFDMTLEDFCLKILTAIAKKDVAEATKVADAACQTVSPAKFIEALFAGYGRAVYPQDDDPFVAYYEPIRAGLPNVSGLTGVFIKWSMSTNFPTDAIPLFIMELSRVHAAPVPVQMGRAARVQGTSSAPTPPAPGQKNAREVMEFLGGKELPTAK